MHCMHRYHRMNPMIGVEVVTAEKWQNAQTCRKGCYVPKALIVAGEFTFMYVRTSTFVRVPQRHV